MTTAVVIWVWPVSPEEAVLFCDLEDVEVMWVDGSGRPPFLEEESSCNTAVNLGPRTVLRVVKE